MKSLKYLAVAALAGLLVLATTPTRTAPVRALDKKLVQRASKASVQLGPILTRKSKGKTQTKVVGIGSGTMLKGGYILTNAHVADIESIQEEAKSQGVQVLEGKMAVMITRRTDEPPIATYIADIVLLDRELDLAMLRIAYDTSGEPIDADAEEITFLDLGNSDTIEIGDTLNIFGYPGIGGDTITFTSGPVSGFSPQGKVARGWIKTSASISGGNSGGTGVDDGGRLVGVPTQAGSGQGKDVVDCRPVADTNGDGRVNSEDTCMPIGGFINSLRPINLAKSLISEAISGGSNNGNSDDPVTEGVLFTGKVVDASTGRPIAGAVFVVLKEGVAWSENVSEEDIYDQAQTDRKGQFATTIPVVRGSSYSLGILAKNYRPVLDDAIEITDAMPDTVNLTIKMQK